jgi:hypothetical protein
VLLSISPIAAKEKPKDFPKVFLNHFYIYTDSTTFKAIASSDFLKNKFGNFKIGTTVADNNESWTGAYLLGKNTYIELFDTKGNKNSGQFGIGFGVEVQGELNSIYTHIRDCGCDIVKKETRYRKIGDEEIMWFESLYFDYEDPDTIMSNWVMEYKFSYMRQKYADIPDARINISRKLYNRDSYKDSLIFEDIVKIEVALEEKEAKRLAEELRYFGFEINRQDNTVYCKGPEVEIVVIPRSDQKLGICEITMILNRKLEKPICIQFGKNSELSINSDGTAIWSFRATQ